MKYNLASVSPLMAIYVVAVFIHIILLLPYFHAGIGVYFVADGNETIGAFVGDEASYRLYAEALLHLNGYPTNPLYPPAYPLLLALAELLWPSDAVAAMIVINIFAATAVMFPIYALARQMLPRDLAVGAAAVSGLMPASFIFAPALMSENLATTVFAIAFWFAVCQRQATSVIAALFGVTLAACFLTKFLFLSTIPFFAIAFVINQWRMTSTLPSHSERAWVIARLTAIVGGVGLVPLAIWCTYLIASGGTLAQAMGIHVATIGMVKPHLPALTFIPPILGLHGLALLASVLPALPAAAVGILYRPREPINFYVILLGGLAIFTWLFVVIFAWISLELFDFPQPIIQRYMMMLVPLFTPLSFVGFERVFSRRNWFPLIWVSATCLALAVLVQAGLYDRIIWPVPAWTTVIWVGACDILYGALGFPVLAVTAISAIVLVALRLAGSVGMSFVPVTQRRIRFVVLAAATMTIAIFNVTTGMSGVRFGWDSPFIASNAVHARSISAIIGDRRRDQRPAVVSIEPAVFDAIEKSTGIRLLDNRSVWWVNLSFWTGRQVTVIESTNQAARTAQYQLSLANPGADPSTTYKVGADTFQIKPRRD